MLPPASSSSERLVFGAMTGTSIDALDAAAVRVVGVGLGMRAELVDALSLPLDHLTTRLRRMASGEALPASEYCALARDLGLLHASAFASLAERAGAPALVGAHGQTVYHAPPRSLQLLDPQPIAAELGVPVVSDLRSADLAQGGQGAPISPIADAVLFLSAAERRAVVNLGGFCNATLLPRAGSVAEALGAIEGFDACACNHVLDGVARGALGAPFDDGGAAALSGSADPGARAHLLGMLRAQGSGRRSLGTGDEGAQWEESWRGRLGARDLLATAAAGVGEAIGSAVAERSPDRVLLAGGGTRNAALVRAIEGSCGAPVYTTAEAGLDPRWREAVAVAVLAALCADGVPITLPRVTGVAPPAPVAGRWTFPPRGAR